MIDIPKDVTAATTLYEKYKPANIIRSSEYIKELLSKQVYSSVCFEQSVRKMIADGYDTFVEVGPGKTLSGFVKKIAKSMEKEVVIK